MIVLISFVELGIVGYFLKLSFNSLGGGGGEGKGDKRQEGFVS